MRVTAGWFGAVSEVAQGAGCDCPPGMVATPMPTQAQTQASASATGRGGKIAWLMLLFGVVAGAAIKGR